MKIIQEFLSEGSIRSTCSGVCNKMVGRGSSRPLIALRRVCKNNCKLQYLIMDYAEQDAISEQSRKFSASIVVVRTWIRRYIKKGDPEKAEYLKKRLREVIGHNFASPLPAQR